MLNTLFSGVLNYSIYTVNKFSRLNRRVEKGWNTKYPRINSTEIYCYSFRAQNGINILYLKHLYTLNYKGKSQRMQYSVPALKWFFYLFQNTNNTQNFGRKAILSCSFVYFYVVLKQYRKLRYKGKWVCVLYTFQVHLKQ